MAKVIHSDSDRTLSVVDGTLLVCKTARGEVHVRLAGARYDQCDPAHVAAVRARGLDPAEMWTLYEDGKRAAATLPVATKEVVKEAIVEADRIQAERNAEYAAEGARIKAREAAELAHDNLYNEGGEGYNPHRVGAARRPAVDRTPSHKPDAE